MKSSIAPVFSGVTRDIGIDLGTTNTLVHVGGCGVVLREPSVIAVSTDDRRNLKVGIEAKRMLGRTPPNIEAVRPLREGVIADYDCTERMLRHFISRVSNRFLLRKRVVVGVPCGATDVERRAVLEATTSAGATHAYVIEEPLAAAIGAGLPVSDPSASIVVDVGGGTTEIAIVSMGAIVLSNSLKVAGDDIDEAIAAYVRRAHNLYIGDRTAEQTKIDVGSVAPLEQELKTEIRGRDLISGLPRGMMIASDEVRSAIREPVAAILQALKVTLEQAPPELAADAMDRGITLTGGGALLRGFDRLLEEQTLVKVRIARDPLTCVVAGAGYAVERMQEDRQVRRMLEKASPR